MLRVKRAHPDAVLPTKAHPDDAGFDLTIISLVKIFPNGVHLYDTGLQIQPPPGFYMDLVPRSSLSKSSYSLANSVGIIDASYRGNVLVALRPMVDDPPPLLVPNRCMQLVPRAIHIMRVEDVAELTPTPRGDGGFGSTDP